MKRIGLHTIVWLAAVIAFIWLIKEPMVSSYLSKTLKIKVFVGNFRVNRQEMKIANLRIDNPVRYKTPTALTADAITASYELNQLMGNPSIIDSIEVDRVFIGVEFSSRVGGKNNWSDLMKHIPKSSDAKEVIIRSLVLTNITVDIKNMGPTGKSETKTIDRMEFSNLSSKEGFPTDQLIKEIFGKAGILDYLIPDVPGTNIIKKLLPF
jgi:hypothetical protein